MKSGDGHGWLGILLGVCLTTTGARATCIAPPADMVAWWPTDGSIVDAVGHNHGSAQGAFTFAEGMVDGALEFNGGRVSVPDAPELNRGFGDFTIDAWIFPTNTTDYREIFHKRVGSGVKELELRIGDAGSDPADGLVWFMTNDGADVTAVSTIPIPTNVWTHLAAVRDGSGLRLYFDGDLVGSAAGPPVDVSSPSPLVIGDFVDIPGHAPFLGRIDELEFFSRALSEVEIDALVAAGADGKCRGDLAECRIDLGVIEGAHVQCVVDLNSALTDLAECQGDLAAATGDGDDDGKTDGEDHCPGTDTGEATDDSGCSQVQFCTSFDATTSGAARQCRKADWKNDEPTMRRSEADCRVDRGSAGRADDRCLPIS